MESVLNCQQHGGAKLLQAIHSDNASSITIWLQANVV